VFNQCIADGREIPHGVRKHLDRSTFGLVTRGVRVEACGPGGLVHIYGQVGSHSISADAPRVHGSDEDHSAAVCTRSTRFGNEEGENGRERKGACKGRGIPPSLSMACFIHVPLMASPEEVRHGILNPLPFRLLKV
jgi:hypothetical protein